MRSFDLTFNGAVLPDRDPGQVRQDLARLFAIDDNALIDKIFSGKTVILRHNLDRKAAADYFRKITLLGGKATLVKSPKHRAVHGDELLILEPNPERLPEKFTSPAPATAVAPEINPKGQAGHEALEAERDELEALSVQTRESADRREASLQRQRERYERIAAEEMEKIDQLLRANSASAERELAELGALAEAALQTASSRVADIEGEKNACRVRSEKSIAHLDHLIARAETEEEAFTDVIKQRLEKTRKASEEEIRRMEQQLAEAIKSAEETTTSLKQELRDTRDKSEAEKEALRKQKADTLHRTVAELSSLEEQLAAARARLECTSAEFGQREQDLRNRGCEESKRLEAMKNDIEARRDQGIAGVNQALNRLTQETPRTLRQLTVTKTEHPTPQVQAQGCGKAAGSGNQ